MHPFQSITTFSTILLGIRFGLNGRHLLLQIWLLWWCSVPTSADYKIKGVRYYMEHVNDQNIFTHNGSPHPYFIYENNNLIMGADDSFYNHSIFLKTCNHHGVRATKRFDVMLFCGPNEKGD